MLNNNALRPGAHAFHTDEITFKLVCKKHVPIHRDPKTNRIGASMRGWDHWYLRERQSACIVRKHKARIR